MIPDSMRDEWRALLLNLVSDVADEYEVEGFDEPAMEVSIAWDGDKWNYQTGDTQCAGPIYTNPYHHTVVITQTTDVDTINELVAEIVEELEDAYVADEHGER